MSHAGGGQGGLPPMIGSPTSRFFGRTSSHSPAAAAAAAAAVPSPFLPAPQPQGDLMPASPAAGGASGGAAVGAVTGAGQVDLAALADQPPARCFVVQMMDVVWQIERGSNGARKPDIAPHRRIMLRPASLKDFQDAVYVWAGVQPGKLTFTIGGSQDPLQESNYHSLETEHEIVAELVDDDAPMGEDVTTVDGLKSRRERLSTGEGWVHLSQIHGRGSPVTFDFRVEGCSQLMLAGSSFKLPVFVMSDPTETPFSTVDSGNKDCFSPDPESFHDVQLTQTININTANPDDRFDRPFQQHLNKVKPVITWHGPPFKSILSSGRRGDWKHDLHDIDVLASEGFTPASCEFFKKAYAGELIFFCDTSFSRPQSNSHRLAVRVKAAWDDGKSSGRLLLQAFVVKAEYFYTHARQHAEEMLAKGKLGLVLDLDKTLVLYDPPQELVEQIEHSGESDRRLRKLRDGRRVALRAGVKDMLDHAHRQHRQNEPPFELHVFCNGTLTYAREVLQVFDLIKYFGPRVTSGYWTTRDELAFGMSGYKDFRSIFDFHRYPQYQEMVLAVDDITATWDNAVKLWRRVHEKPCVLQIRGYAANSMRMSQSNDTVSQFHEVLFKVHELFFHNEELRKGKRAGLTMNTELHEARTPGFMARCCAAAEKQLMLGAAPESPRLQGDKKVVDMVHGLKKTKACNDQSGVAELMKDLQDESKFSLRDLCKVVRQLDLTTRLVRASDGTTVWRMSSNGYGSHPVPEGLRDQARRIWIERINAVYQHEFTEFELQVHFTNKDVPRAKSIKVSVGMPMHDFLHSSILEWEKIMRAEMHGYFGGDMIGNNPIWDLLNNPGLYSLTTGQTAISSSSWYSLTHSLALGSAKTATLVLETSRYARAKYPALYAPPKSHFQAVGEGGVDPDVFLHQNHKMSGRAINRVQEHAANSIDATRNNQLQERKIDIELHEHTNELGNTLYAYTITDNGRGMSETELLAAVTYGKSRNSRGLDVNRWGPDSRTHFVDSVYNRFGVGLLDAGFGMGDGKTTSMYIMTKTIDAPDVIQVALEAESILAKRDGGQKWDIYPKGTRGVGHISDGSIPSKLSYYKTIQELLHREKADECFTTIVVDGVLPQLAEQFKEKNELGKSQLADDLGHAYNYFFATEEPAGRMDVEFPARRQTRHQLARSEAAAIGENDTLERPRCLSVDLEKEKPLQLRLKLPLSAGFARQLLDAQGFIDVSADNLEKRFEIAGKNSRWFFINYVPELLSGHEGSGTTIVKIVGGPHNNQLGTVREYNMTTTDYTVDVNGLLVSLKEDSLKVQPLVALANVRYFPSRDFKETHPMAELIDSQQVLPERQVECRFQGQPLFKENEKMRSLPFASLKGRHKKGVYGTDKLPEKCGQRWRCTIFHDGRWPVGNNKLELSLEDYSGKLGKADFSAFMTTTQMVQCQWYEQWQKPVGQGGRGGWNESWNRKGTDTQPREDFRKWLLESHERFDKDIEYREDDQTQLQPEILAQLEADHQQCVCFDKVVLSDDREFKALDKFSFYDSKARSTVFAEAVTFCQDNESNQGGGTIYYRQMPALFHPKLKHMPLDRLVIDQEKLKFCTFSSDTTQEEKSMAYCAKAMGRIPKNFDLTVKKWTKRPGVDVIDTTAGGERHEFQVDVVDVDGRSLKERGRKKQSVKFGDIPMKIRVVSSARFETLADAPTEGTPYAKLNNDGEPIPCSWHELWTKGCADVGDWVTAPSTPQVAGLYALHFQCIFDTAEARRAVSEGNELPIPDGFDPPTLMQVVEVQPGKPRKFVLDDDCEFEAAGMFHRGMRVGSEDYEDIKLMLADAHDNEIKVDRTFLRSLSIEATARSGHRKLEKTLDRSGGLKVLSSGALLLTLSFDWHTDPVWEQQLFNAGRQPAEFKVELTATLSGQTLQKFEFGLGRPIKIWPRAPTTLQVDNAPDTLTIDEDLGTTLAVQFIDINGQEAAPMPDEERKLNAKLKIGNSSFELAKNAPSVGLQHIVNERWTKVYRQRNFRDLFKRQHSLQAILQFDAVGCALTWTHDVTIRQSQSPTSATVYCGTLEKEATVGADDKSLSGLAIRLRNAQGSVVPWEGQSVSNFKWNGPESWRATPSEESIADQEEFSGNLPAVDLSSDPASKVGKHNFSGSIVVDDGGELELRFAVNVVAGEAVGWNIAQDAAHTAVPCSVSGKLARAFAIKYVDRHCNTVDLSNDDDAPTTPPTVECVSAGVELHHGDLVRVGNEFRLDQSAILTGSLDGEDEINVRLRISDTFRQKDILVTLEAGKAFGIRVMPHDMLADAQGTDNRDSWTYTATVPKSYHLPTLKAKVVDVCGNQVITKHSLKLTAGGEATMANIKGRWSDETSVSEFSPCSDDHNIESNGTAGSYHLEVSCRGLRSARINCTVVLSNKLTAVTAVPPLQLHPIPAVDAQFAVPLVLRLHTENGTPPGIAANCFSVRLKYGGNVQAIGNVEVNGDVATVVSWTDRNNGSPFVPTQAGDYELTYKCRDNRPDIASSHIQDLIVAVVGGRVSKLVLLNSVEDAVTNGDAEDGRVLIEAPLLEVEDKHGNIPTMGTGGAQVYVSLHDEQGTEIAGALDGATTCAVDGATGKVRFSGVVRLREGTGGDSSAKLYLRFAVDGIDGVETTSEPIHFTPHEQIVQQTQTANAVTSGLKTQLKAVKRHLKILEKRLTTEEKQIAQLTHQVDAQFVQAAKLLEDASIEFIDDLRDITQIRIVLKRCNQAKAKIAKDSLPHRQSKRGNGLPGDRLNIAEAVVDVGFVSDPVQAKVLSWAAGKYMKAMVAPDTDRYNKLLRSGQSAFNANTMPPFGDRSEEEKRQGRLPLELPVPAAAGSAWPKHAVNMIELPADLEHHRDTLFWHIYRTLLVVRTLDDAMEYQQACADQSKRCPTIVCLDGKRVESSSFSDPGAYLNLDAVLPFVFGTLPAERTREWEAADRAAEVCDELCNQLEEKERLQKQVGSTRNEIVAEQQEATSLKAQLDQAREHARQAAHPPPSPAASAAVSGDSGANKRSAPGDVTATSTKRPREHDSR